MENTDKGSNRVDREILPFSVRSVEENQSQPGRFPLGRWEQAVRAQLSKAQQPGPASPGQSNRKIQA